MAKPGRPAIPEASRRRLNDAVERLRALFPDGWQVTVRSRRAHSGVITIVADDGVENDVTLVPRDRVEPRDVDWLPLPDGRGIVSAEWLSPRACELLQARDVGYVDRTGNAEIRLRRPALYIRTSGAARDPNPKPTTGPRLRGPRAWALLRTLADVAPPYTAGDLSEALDVDDGYVSRILQVLSGERLVVRRPRGPVTDVDWEGVLRQLTSTYSLFDSNKTSMWVASSGAERLLRDLEALKVRRWALTGSFAATSIAPVAAPEVAVIYAEDPERLAKQARLLPTASGANVVLAEPFDPIVFNRGWAGAGVPCVSVAQMAVDSLTGSARMPAEGTALIDWMRRNETKWQAASLRG